MIQKKSEIMTAKNQLRREMSLKRQQLQPQEIAAYGQKIWQQLQNWPPYQTAGSVLIYLDFRGEAATTAIALDCLARGKSLLVPVSDLRTHTLLASRILCFPEELHSGNYGIREPRPEFIRPTDPLSIELVLLPGLAFTVKGERLGYGGGYYDRFLPLLAPHCPTAALMYEFQLVETVFATEHDVSVQYLISGERIIKTADWQSA